ncbi:MAG: hypothetical protein R3F11_08420 [Verrucomicrobiales bacterium]
MALKDDADLDLKAVRQLMQRGGRTARPCGDAARYQMNGFLIAVSCYVAPLAIRLEELGRVEADLGKNACRGAADHGLSGRCRRCGAGQEEAQDSEVLDFAGGRRIEGWRAGSDAASMVRPCA